MLLGVPTVGVGARASVAFKPTDIAGLKLWLDPFLGVHLSGSTLAQWDDQSGTGNNYAQATPANQMAWSASAFHGGPGIVSMAYPTGLSSTTNPVGQNAARTVFAVLRTDTTSNSGQGYFFQPRGNVSYLISFKNAVTEIETNFATTNTQYSTAPAGDHVVAFTFDGVVTNLLTLDVDAAQNLTVSNGAGVGVGVEGLSGASYLGGDGASGRNGHTAPFASLLVYDTALTATNRAKVSAYLKARFGL
jgi:hypothetical protein